MNKIVISFLLPVFIYSCNTKEASLPILGRATLDESGKEIPHEIPDFSFTNQYNETVTNADFD